MVCDLVDKDENSEATVHMWFGDAEGLEWSNPIETPAKGIVPDKLKELKNGRWLLAAHFKILTMTAVQKRIWVIQAGFSLRTEKYTW